MLASTGVLAALYCRVFHNRVTILSLIWMSQLLRKSQGYRPATIEIRNGACFDFMSSAGYVWLASLIGR